MLSPLLRPFKGRQRVDARRDPPKPSPAAAPDDYARLRHATADFTEADDDDSSDDGPARPGALGGGDDDGDGDEHDEDGRPHPPPSAAALLGLAPG